MPSSPWVTLAHIVRPQGRRGEVIAELLTDFPEKFAERRHVFLTRDAASDTAPREVELTGYRLAQNRVVLHFAGIDSIDAAETLRGLDVVIPESDRAPLDEDAAYISDLVGCEVWDEAAGQRVGIVQDVDRQASHVDLLVVDCENGQRAEIPFVKAFLVKLDTAGKRITMRLPEGLLEINASTATAREPRAPWPRKHSLRKLKSGPDAAPPDSQ
jgi:16S rRNA processing protein RimM